MKQKVAEANARDERMTFVATPAVRALLERVKSCGGRFVWDRTSGRPSSLCEYQCVNGHHDRRRLEQCLFGVWGPALWSKSTRLTARIKTGVIGANSCELRCGRLAPQQLRRGDPASREP